MDRTAIGSALSDLRAGRPVLVHAGTGFGEGYDIVVPAALADTRWAAWAVRWSSGLLFAPLPAEVADALDLPLMVRDSDNPQTRAHAVAVDAAVGVTTGISASDRARTARVLADPGSTPADFTRPGHLVPVVASDGGVLENPGRVEAAVDLCRLAGLPPVALSGQLLRGDGEPVRGPDAVDLGDSHRPPIVDVADLVTHRLFAGDGVRGRVTRMPRAGWSAAHNAFDVAGFIDEVTGAQHLVLHGPTPSDFPVVSVHVECPMGDIFGSDSCACGRRLAEAKARIAVEGGLMVYLRHPYCRDAPIPAAHAWTPADDGALAAILSSLGMSAVRLLEGPANPDLLRLTGITAIPRGRR
ncbi:3,4-dihydroxy-2-butanone-4-phosphate synthase [Nocardia salmonicida]|uniref:3,4-dihydroxy-2-butanone-4-phosphate synthase n=1 Tax=Nocardia salmonicida TaxID=53431 RepID=A0ABZ1N374_9NOCA